MSRIPRPLARIPSLQHHSGGWVPGSAVGARRPATPWCRSSRAPAAQPPRMFASHYDACGRHQSQQRSSPGRNGPPKSAYVGQPRCCSPGCRPGRSLVVGRLDAAGRHDPARIGQAAHRPGRGNHTGRPDGGPVHLRTMLRVLKRNGGTRWSARRALCCSAYKADVSIGHSLGFQTRIEDTARSWSGISTEQVAK